MSDDLAYMSASEAITRFRTGDLAPIELLEAVIERAKAVEPRINAFVDTYFDEARVQAETAARAYADGTARPLEGIPVAVKDEPRIDGQRWTQGSLLFADQIAEGTDVIAERIIASGGIVHARTTTPEFSMAIVTWTLLHGVTRNPWNLAMTCGGSSGGSGASLAAGSTTIACGSDIGGSIRIPASMNGVVGFKPPWGRVPEYGPWNREPYAASGPMGRTVADVVLMERAIAGPLAGDMYSLPEYDLPETYPGLKGRKVALSPDLGYFAPDAPILDALHATADILRHQGAEVVEVRLDWTEQTLDTAMAHLDFQARRVLESHLPEDKRHLLTPYISDMLSRIPVSAEDWMASWDHADQMYLELQEKVFLAGCEALICPTVTTTSIPADLGHPDSDRPQGLADMFSMVMTYPFNILGKLPVVNVPIGIDPGNGIPIGMQIVGPVLEDAVPFGIAAGLETAVGNLYDRERPGLGYPG